MPNRLIKESIHDSEDVSRMNDFEFRLWVNLIAYVDDYGRGDARPEIIKGKCFPLRDEINPKLIAQAINGLEGIGVIRTYSVNGKPYLFFPTWDLHQRIRTKKSKFPAPQTFDSNPQQIAADCSDSPQIAAKCARAGAESESESEIESESESNIGSNIIPTREEVRAFAAEIGSPVDADYFFDWYNNAGWKTAAGEPIKIWRNVFLSWGRNDKQKDKEAVNGNGKRSDGHKDADGEKRFNIHYDA